MILYSNVLERVVEVGEGVCTGDEGRLAGGVRGLDAGRDAGGEGGLCMRCWPQAGMGGLQRTCLMTPGSGVGIE
jgi:hypothetical protein